MKEYLNPLKNGGYELSDFPICTDSIEVPEGAVKAYLNNSGSINFINENDDYANAATHGVWVDTHRGRHEASGHELVWQRNKPVDAEFDVGELPMLTDSVEETLKERQGQYGDFSDVADTTQKLLQTFVGCELSIVQLEALHMICSKLARIKHGDSKKIDSWHDIAGYATLVVNDLSK